MSYEFTVQVLDKKQEAIPDVDVEVYIFMGAWTGKGGSLEATTNSEGYAEFETGDDYDDLDAAQVKIYVEGQEFGPYSLQEDYTVTVESDDDEEEE